MNPLLKQAVEVVFTSYLGPVMILPVLWIASALRARTAPARLVDDERAFARLSFGYGLVATVLVASWAASWFVHGSPAARTGWIPFIAVALVGLHVLFAAVTIRVTSGVARLPGEDARDRMFLRFLGIVILQPIATGAAVSLIVRLLAPGVHPAIPGFESMPGTGI